VFDPARVPAPVRDRLAVIGFWVCPPDLRDKVTHWDGLDDGDAMAAGNDLRLLGMAAAGDSAGMMIGLTAAADGP
jgi:hypothetical protein